MNRKTLFMVGGAAAVVAYFYITGNASASTVPPRPARPDPATPPTPNAGGLASRGSKPPIDGGSIEVLPLAIRPSVTKGAASF